MHPLTDDEEEYLCTIYFDPSHPVSYQNPVHLFQWVKKEGEHSITCEQIDHWLQRQEAYSVNRNVLQNFQHGYVLITGIDDQWDADLADMQDYAPENGGYKYLLCVIDIFSHYAWVEPLKNKATDEIVQAMDKILRKGYRQMLLMILNQLVSNT